MRTLLILSILATLVFPAAAAATPSLPDSIGSAPVLRLTGKSGKWEPDTMYEHVNGEAELLKRYGATVLINAIYENAQGDYLSVDLLDMGASVNAFGLYSLYAGCDGEGYSVSGATVLPGEFTSYAVRGRYFMRIDVESETGSRDGRDLVQDFLSALSGVLPPVEPLPPVVESLQSLAGRPCEVTYHPEHVDYDLESGPGYSWMGTDGGIYFMRLLGSPEEAQVQAAVLRNRGAPTVLVWGNAVTWPKVRTERTSGYLKGVLKKVVKW